MNPMDTHIRFEPAATSHHEMLVDLVRRYYSFDHIPFVESEVRAALTVLLDDANLGRAWIIHRGRDVAGYVVLSFHFDHELGGRTGIMTDLYIETAHRRQGLATATLRFLETQAAGMGLHAIELQVERGNIAAQKLYEKLGYLSFDRIPMTKRLRTPFLQKQ